MFMKDGLDGKKNARQIRECHDNALIQSFEKSPHYNGLSLYPFYGQLLESGSGLD